MASPLVRRRGILRELPHALALFIVLFGLANLLGECLRPGFDANLLWAPLAPVRWWGTRTVLLALLVPLGYSLFRPLRNPWVYAVAQSLLLFLGLNALGLMTGLVRNELTPLLPRRYLLLNILALGALVWRLRRQRVAAASGESPAHGSLAARAAAFGVVALMFLGGQFFLFSADRAFEQADCAVVLGAAVLWNGDLSQPLADRTRTACRLYSDGNVRNLVFSGGPVSEYFTEPMAMRRFARGMGVPAESMVLDEGGLSTYETARDLRRIMARKGWRTAVIVTHDYHLSRTWLTLRRAGVDAWPHAARRSGLGLRRDALVMLRECVAWPYYYLRPLWEPISPAP